MRGAVTFLFVVFLSACTACSATKQQLVTPKGGTTGAYVLPARVPENTHAGSSDKAKSHTEVHVSVLKIVITAPQPGNLVIGSQAGAVVR